MRVFFLLLATTFYFPSFAQLRFDYPIKNIEPVELIASYSMQFKPDSTNPDHIVVEDMSLFLGKNISKFLSYNFYIGDSIFRTISSPEEFEKIVGSRDNPLPIVRFQYQIFKNYPKGKITYVDHILGSGTFKYEENLNLFHWKLTGDTSTINGYKVQKATCNFGGRSWIAWFCPEIPYSDGPYKFNGLPGLIINIHDTRNHYVFVLESIEKPNHKMMIDLVENDIMQTTKKNFFRAKDALRENMIMHAKEAGFNDRESQAIYRKMSRRNNPIELKRK